MREWFGEREGDVPSRFNYSTVAKGEATEEGLNSSTGGLRFFDNLKHDLP